MTTIKPQLSSPFPSGRRIWTCPKTGLKVPMREDENMEYREKLLHRAAKDPVLQRDLLAACKESRLFWVNTFAYTLWEIEVSQTTNGYVPAVDALHPFITFERQEEWFNWADERFRLGEDGLTDKSRDMGASWAHTLMFHHIWLTRPRTQLREMSRVEDMVDSPISKSLFYKHDLVNLYLPEWMCPPGVLRRGRDNRTSMRIHNELNNSTIAGESTNRAALSGDRCAILLLDEFAKVDNGDSIKRATSPVSSCRLVNSTVDMPGSCYSAWKNSGRIKVFSLMAWDHPRKGKGRVVVQDEVTKEYRITSPFIEHEIERSGWKEVAIEIYAMEGAVGDTFFASTEIDKHAAMYARKPSMKLNISLRKKISNEEASRLLLRRRDLKAIRLTRDPKGELSVWASLAKGRLDQTKSYTIGIDLSRGQGGETTTESVASIRCDQTGEIVAKWASKTAPPYDAARTIAALAVWVGGAAPRRLPFIVWEMNGPGWDFGHVFIKQMKYPFYYRDETIGQIVTKKTAKYGWHSNRERKALLLREYERQLREGKVINRDQQSLDQTKTYITYPSGGVGPADLSDKSKAEYLGHGDRTIADALTTLNKVKLRPRTSYSDAPEATWEHRFNRWKRTSKGSKSWQKKF
ncbi:MAG: hypothetical protein JRE28_10355 [Deltaproteobacteria bacterium]|nr:hypothetical protein [Deltaproteobacteria bacterium]